MSAEAESPYKEYFQGIVKDFSINHTQVGDIFLVKLKVAAGIDQPQNRWVSHMTISPEKENIERWLTQKNHFYSNLIGMVAVCGIKGELKPETIVVLPWWLLYIDQEILSAAKF